MRAQFEKVHGRLLSPIEAAIYLGFAPQTLARWRCEGIGPVFVKIGGRIFYESEELAKFVAAHRRYSTGDRKPRQAARGRVPCR